MNDTADVSFNPILLAAGAGLLLFALGMSSGPKYERSRKRRRRKSGKKGKASWYQPDL